MILIFQQIMLYQIGIVKEKLQIYNIMPVNSAAEQDVNSFL